MSIQPFPSKLRGASVTLRKLRVHSLLKGWLLVDGKWIKSDYLEIISGLKGGAASVNEADFEDCYRTVPFVYACNRIHKWERVWSTADMVRLIETHKGFWRQERRYNDKGREDPQGKEFWPDYWVFDKDLRPSRRKTDNAKHTDPVPSPFDEKRFQAV